MECAISLKNDLRLLDPRRERERECVKLGIPFTIELVIGPEPDTERGHLSGQQRDSDDESHSDSDADSESESGPHPATEWDTPTVAA